MLIITQDIVKASVIGLHQRTESKREVARLGAGEANLAIRVIFLFAVESLREDINRKNVFFWALPE